MSAIDTLNHAHVGNFCGIPIYWVIEEGRLESLTNRVEDRDKIINKNYLSIGGGSGEHQALIVNNDALVYQFLGNFVDSETLPEGFEKELVEFAEKIQDRFLEENDEYIEFLQYWDIDQNQWPLETFVSVNNSFKNIELSDFLAGKIKDALALFIIYEMPIEHCLKDSNLVEIAKKLRSSKWEKAFDNKIVSYLTVFNGVLNSQKYGKVIRDNKVIWGYSLTDWLLENNGHCYQASLKM